MNETPREDPEREDKPAAGSPMGAGESEAAGASGAPVSEAAAGAQAGAAAPRVPEAADAVRADAAAPRAPDAATAPRVDATPGDPARDAAAPAPPATPPPPSWRGGFLAERPEQTIEVPRRRLAAQSRRDFVLFAAGLVASAAGAWWLLPDRTRSRLLPGAGHDRLDTLAARVGLTRERREAVLDRALTFDDDVAEALYSKHRRVRTYKRSEVTPLRNNYNGRTPGPEYLPGWTLNVSGLASGRGERLTIDQLESRFTLVEQITRLVCVEGWSAVAWWGGIRFADLLDAYPPAPGARWAQLRSSVNLDGAGGSDPYFVSIDLETARHPQTLLATHQDSTPLTLAHGAPLRLLVPMKLGLKNIKAVTEIAYSIDEPDDYWNLQGYSKYDGL